MLRNSLLVVMTLAAVMLGGFLYQLHQKLDEIQKTNAATVRARSAEKSAQRDKDQAQQAQLDAITNECWASRQNLEMNRQNGKALDDYLSCGLRLGYALVRDKRPEDAEKSLSQLRKSALSNIGERDDPVKAFYLLLIAQLSAVARCASTTSGSEDRSDAIAQLASASKQVIRFEPPLGLSERWSGGLDLRWREEAVRGIIYLSTYSSNKSEQDLAFQYAQAVVQTLSKRGADRADTIRPLARALDHLAWMALITERYSEAIKASKQAVQLVPTFIEA
jgi:hypothetical protein